METGEKERKRERPAEDRVLQMLQIYVAYGMCSSRWDCRTHRTSVFIRRSMLVLLNFVRPLFCINLVSGPMEVNTLRNCHYQILQHFFQRVIHKHTHTCKYDKTVAALSVAQYTAPQQHVLVGQSILTISPV